MERLIGLLGVGVMIGLVWVLSSHRRRFPTRVVVGGLILQFVFAFLVLKTGPGQAVFEHLGHVFTLLLGFVDAGSEFVFGPNFRDFFFVFKVLPTIIFFSSLTMLLYHFGVMQFVIQTLAVVMQKTLRISGAESIAAASNIFVGQTEAPLVVRPYIESMTQSELMSLMVGGFATAAGGVLAAYVEMGINAAHLITASVISAPAALLVAKVLQPEVDDPKTLGRVQIDVKRVSVNAIDAIARGAGDGVKLAINVAAMLIVFLAFIALVNALLAWIGGWFGQAWSLENSFAYLFAPFAWLMGIESGDCLRAGQLLGTKMVFTEFIAYEQLASWLKPDSDVRLSERSVLILTYALCGFANFGSIGIQLGGIGSLAPSRASDLARIGLKAMLGGTIAAFMTACIAGVVI